MKALALVLSVLVIANPASADGFVKLESTHTVKETIDRLAAAVEQRGLKVAARVDHAAAAKAAGLELPPTEVLIFGNPKLGTLLMQANPQIGADLPMKVLAWQDMNGKVWIGYTAPAELKARHGISGHDEAFGKMAQALDGLARGAAAK